MKELANTFIDEAINLELIVSTLYFRFYELFPEDADLWWRLTVEEKNHAALLKNLKRVISLVGSPPEELLALKTDDIKIACDRISQVLDTFSAQDTRRKAFDLAIEIEESAGEAHYQAFIDQKGLTEEYLIFQRLNLEDKDHAKLLRQYVADHNI